MYGGSTCGNAECSDGGCAEFPHYCVLPFGWGVRLRPHVEPPYMAACNLRTIFTRKARSISEWSETTGWNMGKAVRKMTWVILRTALVGSP